MISHSNRLRIAARLLSACFAGGAAVSLAAPVEAFPAPNPTRAQAGSAATSEGELMQSLEQAFARRQRTEASGILTKLLNRPHLEADTLLKAGVLFAQQELFADAARAFSRCAQDYPTLFEAHYNLALADFALRKYPEAFDAIEKAPANSPEEKIARQYLRGKVESALGKMGEAQSDLERAFSQAPQEENYALDLGLFYLRQELYARASATFEKGVQENPSSPYLWLGFSLALFQEGQYARCLEACRRLVELQPDFSPARLMTAFVLNLEGKLPDAEKAAAQGLAVPHPHPYLYYYHVALLLKLHSTDYDRMLRELAKAEKEIPECSLCALAESKIHQAQGNVATATADLERAVKQDPDFAEAWYRLALLYERAGRTQDAERARVRHSQIKAQESDREAQTLRQVFLKSLTTQESQGSQR